MFTQAAREPLLLGRDAVGGGDVERPVGEREARARRAGSSAASRARSSSRARSAGTARSRRRSRRKPADDQPRDAEARDQRRRSRGARSATSSAAGEDREPGLERRPAAQLLHVERRDELEAEPAAEQRHRADVGPHERAPSAGCRAAPAARACAARCATNAASSAATPTNEPSVRAEAQPTSGASTTVKTSSSIAAVTVTAPARSNAAPRAGRPALGRARAGCAGEQRDQRDRDGQEEHPAPADLGQQAAEHEPEREAGGPGRGVDRAAPGCARGPRRSWW